MDASFPRGRSWCGAPAAPVSAAARRLGDDVTSNTTKMMVIMLVDDDPPRPGVNLGPTRVASAASRATMARLPVGLASDAGRWWAA